MSQPFFVRSLSLAERKAIRKLRKRPPNVEVYRRTQAVHFSSEGLKVHQIAEIVGRSRVSVTRWLHKFDKHGLPALWPGKSTGRPRRLTCDQERELEAILSRGAVSNGWSNELWTASRVAQVIQCHFGFEYCASHVSGILRDRLGWTCQMPTYQVRERDEVEISRWKNRHFPRIQLSAKKRKAYITFIDETGFMLAPTRRRSYSPRGKRPVFKVSEPHDRISTICAITVSPINRRANLFFYLLPDNENFYGRPLVSFLELLDRQIRAPLTIVWDSVPFHAAAPVKSYAAKTAHVRIEPFPPYASELNPADGVWCYLKSSRLGNYAPLKLDQLRARVETELDRLRRRPDLLRGFIRRTGLMFTSD